ncbi:hypothetical protein HMPREF3232_00288 [Fannyhessea vaginae]|nr:hypothetical protein HMPREF3232_00288 [Fannyhessea vaginae]
MISSSISRLVLTDISPVHYCALQAQNAHVDAQIPLPCNKIS